MPKDNRFVFQVTGSGEFPFDMLRYDTCWPSGQDDVTTMTRGQRRIAAQQFRENRTVTLRGLRAPTIDRWRSFGWTVNVDTMRKVPVG